MWAMGKIGPHPHADSDLACRHRRRSRSLLAPRLEAGRGFDGWLARVGLFRLEPFPRNSEQIMMLKVPLQASEERSNQVPQNLFLFAAPEHGFCRVSLSPGGIPSEKCGTVHTPRRCSSLCGAAPLALFHSSRRTLSPWGKPPKT